MRSRIHLPVLLAILATALLLGPRSSRGDDEKAPATVTVESGRLCDVLAVSGTLVPRDEAEVVIRPEEYSGRLDIVEAVEPGPVLAGQVLVRFDDEALERQLRDRRRDLQVARLDFERKEDETRAKRELLELGLEQGELRTQRAIEELERWLKIERPLRIERSVFGLEGMRNRLQDSVEELEQLEKMYGADELTEETEAIVLRRARRNLERSRRSLGFQEHNHEVLVSLTLPREERDRKLDVEKKKVELVNQRSATRVDMRKMRISLEKAQQDLRRREEALHDLEVDLEGLRVTSPIDGFAVPGRFRDGKWAEVSGMRRTLSTGGSVKAGTVLFTVVRPGSVDFVGGVSEKELLRVKSGMPVVLQAGIDAGTDLVGAVGELLPIGSGGKHVVHVRLEPAPKPLLAFLMPGQTAKGQIGLATTGDVLHVPAKAVAEVDGVHRVWLWTDGAAVPRDVEVGVTRKNRTEIRSGLEAGDVILASPPEEAE